MAGHDLNDALLKIRMSTKAFGQMVLPDHFSRPCDTKHDEMFELLDDPTLRKKVIAAPRGIGKTTTVNTLVLRHIVFGLSRYIVYVSANQTSAIEHTENIKNELLNNKVINALVGDVTTNIFSQERWDCKVTDSHTCRVVPAGPGQAIRGKKFGYSRPDLIIMDDLENDENVESEEQRYKLMSWVNGALLNSVDRGGKWEVIVIGTILHHDSMLANLMDAERFPSWHRKKFSICDQQYKSLYPNFISDADVMELVEDHRARGMLAQFSREYMNEPVAEEERSFRSEYFKYYDEDGSLNDARDVVNVVMIDPAKTVSRGSCDTAITGVGVNTETNQIFVRDILMGKMSPYELYDEAFNMCERLNAKVLGIEVTSLNEFIMQPIRNEMTKRGVFVDLVEVKPRDKKEKRAGALIPYYRQGMVYHNKTCTMRLENSLIEWPRCGYWDVIDSYSPLIPIMEEGSMYFEKLKEKEDDLDYDFALYEKLLKEDRECEPLGDYRII